MKRNYRGRMTEQEREQYQINQGWEGLAMALEVHHRIGKAMAKQIAMTLADHPGPAAVRWSAMSWAEQQDYIWEQWENINRDHNREQS